MGPLPIQGPHRESMLLSWLSNGRGSGALCLHEFDLDSMVGVAELITSLKGGAGIGNAKRRVNAWLLRRGFTPNQVIAV